MSIYNIQFTGITCVICNKPVDKVEYWRNMRSMDRVMTVYCHGEKETRSISPEETEQCAKIIKAEAFNKRLELQRQRICLDV